MSEEEATSALELIKLEIGKWERQEITEEQCIARLRQITKQFVPEPINLVDPEHNLPNNAP